MSDMCEEAAVLPESGQSCPVITDALSIYLALNKPDLQTAIGRYAEAHRISKSTAVAEACRSYFLGE